MKKICYFSMALSVVLIFLGCSAKKNSHYYGQNQPIEISNAGTYSSFTFDRSASEIAAFDPDSSRVFVVNGGRKAIDILDISNPEKIEKTGEIEIKKYGGGINSVACKNGIVAAAVEADPKQNPGKIVFFNAEGMFISMVESGSLPDMLTFTPDGNYVLAANEGEPSEDYKNDPEGSVTIINIKNGIENPVVKTADFNKFDYQIYQLIRKGVRIFGPGATVSKDLEPEYIAVSDDSKKAYVSLQENNAIAVLDIEAAQITDIFPLGFKYHSKSGSGFDASDKDEKINIKPWPVMGMYQPDSIAYYEVDKISYLVTANEGDARDYEGYSEETRVGKLLLDKRIFPAAEKLQEKQALGRLKTTTALGDMDHDGLHEKIYSFGGRSFSIFKINEKGLELVYDSGSFIEEKLAKLIPDYFNCGNTDNKFDSRSDDKGCEPEALTLGKIEGKTYAFLGLERISGIMIFDITNPLKPEFVLYENNRNFKVDPEEKNIEKTGDLGPEGLVFISADISPFHCPALISANEVSGTTTVFLIQKK